MTTFIPYIVALVLSATTVHSLRCYTCDSKDTPTCKSSSHNIYKECPSADVGAFNGILGKPQCYTATAHKNGSLEYVSRGCIFPPLTGCDTYLTSYPLSDYQKSADFTVNCTICDTNKCNSASKMAGFTVLGLLLANLALLF